MAKIKIILIGLLLTAICASHTYAGSSIECVAKVYTSQIGVREATGKNDGKQVESYLATVKLGQGYSWCAAFVNWSYRQCGIKTINSAWVPSWFAKANLVYVRGKPSQIPQKADVFGIWFPAKGRIAHIGFVDAWQPEKGMCVTVEGNTNDALSREGDGVYRKRRPIRTIYAVARWLN